MSKEQNEIKLDDSSHNRSENSIKLDVSDLNNTNNQEEPLDSKIRYNSSFSSKNDEPPKPIQEQKVDVLPTLSNQIKTEESMVPPYFHGTLNEPILSTLKRDLLNIWFKMTFVLNPFADQSKKNYHIAQWDLWGPLIFTTIFSLTTSIEAGEFQFVLIFSVFWLGTVMIYFNGIMIGVKLSFCSYGCLLGYSLVPLVIASIPLSIINFHIVVEFMIVLVFGIWSIYVSLRFMKTKITMEKMFLVMYPICLFFIFFMGFLLTNHEVEKEENK